MSESLSLGTFEPQYAQPPFLNTPRSLEACRIHGVNPVELVEIPIDEFRKDFPDDADAAQRRYERIDGARRRILATVLAEWEHLCEIGWTPYVKPKPHIGESIIAVPEVAHCSVLELQATRFRKTEQEMVKSFQKLLHVSMQKAAEEVHHKHIVERHREMDRKISDTKKERQQLLSAMFQDKITEQKQRAEEEEELTRLAKTKAQDEVLRKAQEEAQRKATEKRLREEKESNRVQDQEYTQGKRTFILDKMQTVFDQRRIMQEKKNEEIQEKIRLTKCVSEFLFLASCFTFYLFYICLIFGDWFCKLDIRSFFSI